MAHADVGKVAELAYNTSVHEGYNVTKRIHVPVSTARAKLFELTNLVRSSDDDTVVVLEQRGGLPPVALVREARLAYLEARVAELDKRTERPFALAGSLTSKLDDRSLDASLRAIRMEWTPAARKARPARRSATAPRRRR